MKLLRFRESDINLTQPFLTFTMINHKRLKFFMPVGFPLQRWAVLGVLLMLLAACGNKEKSIDDVLATDDLEKIRSYKNELVEQEKELAGKIDRLEKRIDSLSPLTNVPLVTALTLEDTLFEHYLEIQGNVETEQNLVLFPEMSGVLTKVYVDEGDNVKKGQVLAKIDDAGMSQQLQQAEVQAELAKTTYERQKNLWDQKIGSEIQYLQAKTNYEAQQKQVASLRRQLAKTKIKAPFSGTIDEVITEEGSVVNPGANAIFRIVSLDEMYVTAEVPERYLSTVEEGKEVLVEFPVLGKTVTSAISQTSSFINPANRTFRIEVDIPNTDFQVKPNLTARLRINDYRSENAILIPAEIISENQDGEQYVMQLLPADQGENFPEASRQVITTGLGQNGMVEVNEGLGAGDKVIVEGARSVRSGQKVEVID